MSIITQEKTHEDEVQALFELVKHLNLKLYNRNNMVFTQLMGLVWQVPTVEMVEDKEVITPPEISPQELFDKFGTEAYQLFDMSNAIQAMMQAVDPNYVAKTPPYEYTINEDGTVTVGNLIEQGET